MLFDKIANAIRKLKQSRPNLESSESSRIWLRKDNSIYLLRKLYWISSDNKPIIKDNKTNSIIYLLTKSLLYRLIKAPAPMKGVDIIINRVKDLIEYVISICNLEEDGGYKINIYNENYFCLETDKQLHLYNGTILYIKIMKLKNEDSQQDSSQAKINGISDKTLPRNKSLNSIINVNGIAKRSGNQRKSNFQSQTNSFQFPDISIDKSSSNIALQNPTIVNVQRNWGFYNNAQQHEYIIGYKHNECNHASGFTSCFDQKRLLRNNSTDNYKEHNHIDRYCHIYNNNHHDLQSQQRDSSARKEQIIKRILKRNSMDIKLNKNKSESAACEDDKKSNDKTMDNDLDINNNLIYVVRNKFPCRGKYQQPLPKLHKSNSMNNLESTNSPGKALAKERAKLNPYLINSIKINATKKEKIEMIKSFLSSPRNIDLIANKTSDIIKSHDNDNIKHEYTSFLLELRQAVLQQIHLIITDSMLLSYPSFVSHFTFLSQYEHSFPFNQSIKEFILYSYLSNFCVNKYKSLLNSIFAKDHIKRSEITDCISDWKNELISIISSPNDINTFMNQFKDATDITFSSIFFEVFVWCADYFNGYQSDIADIIMIVWDIDLNNKKITYSKFIEYFLYFRCSDLLTNEQKYIFIQKIVTWIQGNGIYNQNLLKDANVLIEIRKVFHIDDMTMKKCNEKSDLGKRENNHNKRYRKMDTIYNKIIYYFTYQH